MVAQIERGGYHRLLPNDPDKYLRRAKNCIQVRPWKDGQRHYLGSFPLNKKREAQKARDEFLAGTRKAKPKYVKGYRSLRGVTIRIELILDGQRIIRNVDDPGEAAEVVYAELVRRLGEVKAKEAIKRK